MTKRVTIVIDDITNKKVRKLHSRLISESDHSVSFSRVVNLLMEEGLKHLK